MLGRAGTVQDFQGSVRFRFSYPRFDFFESVCICIKYHEIIRLRIYPFVIMCNKI